MFPVIVVTELRSLPPDERWQKLVLPLEQQLSESGLGKILDFEALRRQATEFGYCTADEVAVELRHFDYGRDLVSRVLAEAGIPPSPPVMPLRWQVYGCKEYFTADWALNGYSDEFSQTPVVVPVTEAYEDVEHQFLLIGHSGGDGIHFGYRSEHAGLWAYPVDDEFQFMADTLAELVDGWCSGNLVL